MDNTEKKSGRILITGGTSGLGLELVRNFLRLNYEVFATGRYQKDDLFPDTGKFHFIKVDFSDLNEVVAVFNGLLLNSPGLDIIINNAGVLSPPQFTITRDGFEYTFQVNFLAHLLLNELILSNTDLKRTVKIVSVTSPVYRFAARVNDFCSDGSEYKAFKSYKSSKLSLVLMGIYLSEKYKENNLRCFSFNPGTFRSRIYRTQKNWFQKMYIIASPFMRNPIEAAHTLAEILVGREIINGAIYSSKNRYKILEHIDKVIIDEFMAGSYRKIQSYFR